MNYYLNIKEELINNEVYKKVKDYSKNKSLEIKDLVKNPIILKTNKEIIKEKALKK